MGGTEEGCCEEQEDEGSDLAPRLRLPARKERREQHHNDKTALHKILGCCKEEEEGEKGGPDAIIQ